MRKIKNLEKNMIIFLMVFSMAFTLFYIPVKAKETVSIRSFYSHDFETTYHATLSSYYHHEAEFANISSFFNNIPLDRFYKVEYATIINFSSDANVDFSSLNLNITLPLFGDTYTCNIYDFNSEKHVTGPVMGFETTQNGYFVIQNNDYFSGGIPFDLSLSYAPSVIRNISNHIDIEFVILSIEELTKSEIEIYQAAYKEGYDVGKIHGYNDGMSDGQQLGYDKGYDAAYEDAYEDAYDDAYEDAYDYAYNQGVQDGQNSVDTDQYYDHGFLDGVNSVDTDSYFQAGYQAGLTSGYDAAYSEGYNSGFNLGYAEAYKDIKNEVLEDLGSSGTSEGESFTVVQDLDISDSNLTFNEANTTLPSVYEYESDFEYELLYSESFHEFSEYNGEPFGDSYTSYESMIESQSDLRAFSYYYTGAKKLFTADQSAYAYKIELQLANTSYEQNNILWARNTIGKWSDIMSGKSELGLGFSNGSVGNFTYYIVTDNIPADIYSAILFYYKTTDYSDTSFDLSSKMTFKITPYSRNEYAAMMQNMDQNFDDLEDALSKEFEDLKNGYDTSDGDNSNNDLDDSLDGFSEAEDSLFEDSKSSLSDFEFFDFNSVPAMLTGISFVTASMTSIYNAMGGNSGIGIILSVLFSVMLISICLGIYKRYQSKR